MYRLKTQLKQLNASTKGIETFISALGNNKTIQEALEIAETPKAAQDFVNYTFSIVWIFNTNKSLPGYIDKTIKTSFNKEEKKESFHFCRKRD